MDSIQAVLEKSATSYAAATVILSEAQSPASERTRHRMKMLAPHFRRAIQIGKVIDLKDVKIAALADALDGIAAGVWLLDADARIVHVNAAGQVMQTERAVARTSDGKLTLTDQSAAQTLQELLVNRGASAALIGDKGISMPLRGQDGKEYVAQILPLTSGSRRAAGTPRSATAALVHSRRNALPSPSFRDDRGPLQINGIRTARTDDDRRSRRCAAGRACPGRL
jgi:hypothetical protein